MFCELYAQTETLGPTLKIAPLGPEGNCGTVIEAISRVKLVDVKTGNEITEPNVPGEMYCKPRFGFSEYYNDPVETQRAFVDGWFKTGDILYRDAEGYFFYVDRLKALIKYRGYHVYPSEIEDLIRTLEGDQDVCVTSIPHIEDREHPVACVVKKPGSNITEEHIKDIVKNNMSVNNEIRGGVIFLKELPVTSTGKVARRHLKTIVMKMKNISA